MGLTLSESFLDVLDQFEDDSMSLLVVQGCLGALPGRRRGRWRGLLAVSRRLAGCIDKDGPMLLEIQPRTPVRFD